MAFLSTENHSLTPSPIYRQSRYLFLAIGVVILLAILASLLYPTYLSGNAQTDVGRLDTGWAYQQDDIWIAIPTLPRTLEKQGDTLVLRHNLTGAEALPLDYLLTFRTRYASIRVWADDALIYEAAEGKEHALSSMWHFIPLASCEGASTLKVELRKYEDHNRWELESVLLDRPASIQYHLLLRNLPAILFGFVCLLLTLSLVLFTVATTARKGPMALPLLSLSCFVLLSGLWILLDSKITTVFGGNYALTYFLSYAAFYLLLVPYLLYIRLMLKSQNRLLSLLTWAFLVNAGICFVLHMTGLVPIRHTTIVVHILIVLSILVSTLEFWHSIVRKRERQLLFTFCGSMAVYLLGILSIVFYQLGKFETINNTTFYIWGLSIQLIGMTIDAIAAFRHFWKQKESLDHYRQLAVVDSMTNLGNRNAFQAHLSHLENHLPKRLSFILFDIDNLKMVNDQIGHHVGDQTIYMVARCIGETFSSLGQSYRIGGDEFCVIIENHSVSKITHALTRFQEEFDVCRPHLPDCVDVSYGWASEESKEIHLSAAKPFSELIEKADQQMYHLKREHKENASF